VSQLSSRDHILMHSDLIFHWADLLQLVHWGVFWCFWAVVQNVHKVCHWTIYLHSHSYSGQLGIYHKGPASNPMFYSVCVDCALIACGHMTNHCQLQHWSPSKNNYAWDLSWHPLVIFAEVKPSHYQLWPVLTLMPHASPVVPASLQGNSQAQVNI
jgi:hypothetical protein